MAYYVSEDLKDKRGEILLDKSCVIEVGEKRLHAVHSSITFRCLNCKQKLKAIVFEFSYMGQNIGK